MKVGEFYVAVGLSVVRWICVLDVLVDWSFGMNGVSGFVDDGVETIVIVSGVGDFSGGAIGFD